MRTHLTFLEGAHWHGTPRGLAAHLRGGGSLDGVRVLWLHLDDDCSFDGLPGALGAPSLEALGLSVDMRTALRLVERQPGGEPVPPWVARALALAPFRRLQIEVSWSGSLDAPGVERWLAAALGPGAPRCEALESIDLLSCGASRLLLARMARWPLGALRELHLERGLLGRRGLDALRCCPWRSGLTALSLESCGLSDEAAARLLGALPMATLVDLCLPGSGAGLAFARALAARGAPALRELSLNDCAVDDGAIGALVEARLPSLAELYLRGNLLTDDGACALAASPLGRQLDELYLGLDYGHALTLRGLHALVASTRCRQRVLQMTSALLDDDDLCAIARDPRLAAFEGLSLERMRFSSRGIEALAASPHAAGLCGLALGGSRPGREGIEALASSPHLARLGSLDLDFSDLAGAGAAALLRAPFAPSLGRLSLRGCQLSSDDLAAFASCPLPSLEYLQLSSNPVGDEGALALACAANLGHLRELFLAHAGLSDDGALLLLESPALASVEHFYLHGNQLSAALRERIDRDPRVESC